MRINQLRQIAIFLADDEVIPYKYRENTQGFIRELHVRVNKTGACMLTFIGDYFDFLDLEPSPEESGVRAKKKEFRIEVNVATLRLQDDDPLQLLLGKLNLMRQDEMSMETFLSQEDPVG